jgi:hypothetical protein
MKCIHCEKEVTKGSGHWAWFGRTGPFCNRECREEWLREEGYEEAKPLYGGDVLAHCYNCHQIVEVDEGWVAPEHSTPAGKKKCAGSGKPTTGYEKFRYEMEAKAFHRSNKDEKQRKRDDMTEKQKRDEKPCQHNGYVMKRHPDGERYEDIETEQPYCPKCGEFVEL